MKYLFSLCILVLSSATFASTPEILETGDGFVRLRVTDPEYQETIRSQITEGVRLGVAQGIPLKNPGAMTSVSSVPQLTGEIVVLETLRGVMSANIPDWTKVEIFTEEGFTEESFSFITDAQLDAKIARRVIDMDAISPISVQNFDSTMESVVTPAPNGMKRLANAGSMYPSFAGTTVKSWGSFWKGVRNSITDSLCLKKEEDKFYHKDFSLAKDKPLGEREVSEGGFTGSMTLFASTEGTGSADVFYKVSKRCGLPYSMEFKRAEIKVDATIGGTVGLNAKASYLYKNRLFSQDFKYQLIEYDFWIYIFQFRLAADVKFTVGVDFSLAAMAELETSYTLGGFAKFTWICTSSDCVPTRSLWGMEPVLKSATKYQAQLEVKVVPFVDTSIGAQLNLYWALQLVSARVGILAELPVTLFAYAGNMCSDANGDGMSEEVRAAYLDISAQFSGYFDVKLLGKYTRYELDLKLSGMGYNKVVNLGEGDLAGKRILYARSLYFKDLLSGGSSILQAVVIAPKVTKPVASISLSKRSCSQFTTTVFEIDWGDGSTIQKSTGATLSHTYARMGDYTVRVRAVGDDQGRTFDSAWITRKINVSPDGIHPFYPWLPSLLSELLD